MRGTHSLRLRVLVGALALVSACGTSDASGDGGGGHAHAKPTGAVCPTTQTLTYENFGKGFMETYCLQCHSENLTGAERQGAPGDHNFDTVQGIRTEAEHIDEHAGAGPDSVNTMMPENDPRPSEDERRKLSEWLACDAPSEP